MHEPRRKARCLQGNIAQVHDRLGLGGEQVSSDEDECLGCCQNLYLWLASTADNGDA
jgi:hypothetical protein